MSLKEYLSNIKTPISVILSAVFATFVYSVGELFLDSKEYESLIWLVDTTIYSFLVICLMDIIINYFNNKRTLVDVSFYNPSQRNNTLFFDEKNKIHTLKVYINVSGNSFDTNNILRIYEPEGLTLQLNKKPKYINIYDGSHYEIDLSVLMGINKEGLIIKKKNMEIKRSLEFEVSLDDEDNNEYEDNISVDREPKNLSDCLLFSLRQTSIKIKR